MAAICDYTRPPPPVPTGGPAREQGAAGAVHGMVRTCPGAAPCASTPAGNETRVVNIRRSIFLWIFVATILPLTGLALAATYYVQTSHRQSQEADIAAGLGNLAGEIRRRHQAEQALVLGLARSPAVREILPVLYERRRGNAHPEINVRRARINRFFRGLGTILPGYFAIRVLDYQGNTLIKVSHRRVSPAIYEGIEGVPLVEPELNDPAFMRRLDRLPRKRVSLITLPHRLREAEDMKHLPKQDYIVPLYHRRRLVGALTVTLLGGELDRIMEHAPRLHQGRLLLVELNPDHEARNGLVLFDDARNLRLAQPRSGPLMVDDLLDQAVTSALEGEDGRLALPGGRTLYYTAFFPAQDELVNWVLALVVEDNRLTAPFRQIRAAIWGVAGVALFMTLGLSGIGVRNIARPVRTLAARLKQFADGHREVRAGVRSRVDEIRELGEAFDYMADTIVRVESERDRARELMLRSAKLASLGQMAAGIGHELNNPLNNILSYAKLLKRALPDDPDLRRDLDSLQQEALRATEIVRGVLNFARQVPPRYGEFRLGPWLAATAALVEQAARARHVDLRLLDRCPPDQTMEGDSGQLQQALVNLLLNAIAASPEGGQVVVGARCDGDSVLVTVRDEGTGIDEAVRDRLFDPFFTTKPEGEGTGLGLSIALGIVEHHGGSLDLHNNPDQGATASMRLPLRRPQPSADTGGGTGDAP